MSQKLRALLTVILLMAADSAMAVDSGPLIKLTVGTAPDGQAALICIYDAGFGEFRVYLPIGSQCPMRWQTPGPGHDTRM